MTVQRVLVVMVDALGRHEVERFSEQLGFLPHRRSVEGVLGYTSGALPTLLTGASPAAHGRMCLFSRLPEGQESILAPLGWLGLLPRVLHERGRLRRLVGMTLARAAGLTGYVALHRVPPDAFRWLDLPERDDMFTAPDVGGVPTFLADARAAGLSVHACRWQTQEPRRWEDSLLALRARPPDLAFLYAGELDRVLHADGSASRRAHETMARIGGNVQAAREAMSQGGAELSTLVVGDHGMADVHRLVDPRPALSALPVRLRVFVDSTMLRVWGPAADLDLVRRACEAQAFPGTWLDRRELESRQVPVRESLYGDAVFLLPEGAIFAPSFVGGRLAGMHGYDLSSSSARAALLSDQDLPVACRSLTDVAAIVRDRLGLR
jgi:hypothetical protein